MGGNTVACMGTFRGLDQARNVIIDCMHNIHPVYHIKTMMIKRELEKDPTLAHENWDRFLPKFKKKNIKRKKVEIKKRVYTPFPPAPQPSKIDQQLGSGEYFLNEKQRQLKKNYEKQEEVREKTLQKKLEREKEYLPPPEEKVEKKKKKRKLEDDMEEQRKENGKEENDMEGESNDEDSRRNAKR